MSSEEAKGAKETLMPLPATPLFAWIKAELKSKPEKVERALLLFEGALILEEMGRIGESAKAMVAAANSDPLLLPAVWQLLSIFLHRKSWKNVQRLRAAEKKAAQSPEERALALVAWSEHLEESEGDLEGAKTSLLEALDNTPENQFARLTLERVATRTGDLGVLARTLEQQIESTTDERRKALMLVDLAHLQESLAKGGVDRAIELLRQAVSIEEGRWYWLTALQRYAERVERHEAVAEALEGRAEIMTAMSSIETAAEAAQTDAPRVTDPSEAAILAAALYRRAARVREQQVGDREKALDDLRRAAALVPGDRVTFEALLHLAEREQRWDEVLTYLRVHIEAGEDAEDVALLELRLADVLSQCGEHEEAASIYRSVLEASPQALSALVRLEALQESGGGGRELRDFYVSAAEACGDESRDLATALYLRAAEISEELDDGERAFDCVAKARESSSNQRLIDRVRVELHARQERWDEVAALLGKLASESEDDGEALQLLIELAIIQQGALNDASAAVATLGNVLERDPGALWALVLRAEIAASAHRWTDTADSYRRLAEIELTDAQAAAHLSVAGWLYCCRGDRPQDAEACFREALERRTDSALAAAGLEELARRGEDEAGLRDLLRERADRATSGSEVERLLLALAVEHEKSGELEEAVGVYRELVERGVNPQNGRWGLVRCHRRLGAWRELTEDLESLEAELDGPNRGALLLELAELFSDHLGDQAMAEDVLGRAHDADGDLLGVVFRLADHARANGEWRQLDELLQETLRIAPEAALLVAEERLALAAGPLHDGDAVQVLCDVLLENIPNHRPALFWKALLGAERRDRGMRAEAWRELSHIEGDSALGGALRAHVDTMHHAAGEMDALAPLDEEELSPTTVLLHADAGDLGFERARELLEQRVRLCANEASRTFWQLELGRALEVAGELDAADELYREILEARPREVGALEGRRRVARQQDDFRGFAELSEELAQIYGESRSTAQLWADAGQAWSRVDGCESNAEAACRRSLSSDPELRRPFLTLLEILRERRDRAGLSDVLGQRIGVVDEPSELVTLLMAQAGVLRDLGENEEAAGCLETAILVDSKNLEALRGRAALDIADGRWTAAANSLGAWAAEAEEDERRRIHWQNAELLDQELGNPVSALDPLLSLVDSGDQHPDTYRRLLFVARRAKAWRMAARAAARLADLTEDADERIDALRVQGWILQSIADDPGAARNAWFMLLSEQPHDIQALEAIVSMADGGEKKELLSALSTQLRARLQTEPTEANALRGLLKVRQLEENEDGAFCILQALDALGLADGGEQEQLADLRARAHQVPQRPLRPESLELLRHPQQAGLADDLSKLLAPVYHKIFAADVAALRLGRPVKPRGGDLLSERLRGAAEVFGLDRISIRRSGEGMVGIVAVPGPEPAFAVGPQVSGDLTPRFLHELGRAIWHSLAQTAPFAQRTEAQVRAFHDAAIREGDRSFQPTEKRLGVEALQREIHRAIPRRAKRHLIELATAMSQMKERELAKWGQAVKASAERAGLLLAGDVSTALSLIVPGWRGESMASRAASASRVSVHPAARELLLFAVSDDYLALRHEIGLNIESW